MTVTTHPDISSIRRPTLRDLVRRWAAGLAPLIQWLRAGFAEIAAAGQLGPDPETEIGRWTGARV